MARPLEMLVLSAFGTGRMADNDATRALVTVSIGICGRTLAGRMMADDDPILFAPVSFVRAGAETRGCVLALEDRALFAWWTGWVDRTVSVAVVPYASMTGIRLATRPGSWLTLPRRMIHLQADQAWTIIVPNGFGDMPIAALLAAIFEMAVHEVNAETVERVNHDARRRRERADLLLLT